MSQLSLLKRKPYKTISEVQNTVFQSSNPSPMESYVILLILQENNVLLSKNYSEKLHFKTYYTKPYQYFSK